MDNPTIDYEFDVTRTHSDALGYGDGYVGEEQRRQLERKYIITRKPIADVDHPENKLEYAAAVRMYHPGLTETEALGWLLDNTAYPFETLQTVRQELRRAWFKALDKTPYELLLGNMFPQLDSDFRQHVLERALEPDTEDVGLALSCAAEHILEQQARSTEIQERSAARDAEAQQKWEENTESRETRRAAYRVKAAYDHKARAENELARATVRLAEALTAQAA